MNSHQQALDRVEQALNADQPEVALKLLREINMGASASVLSLHRQAMLEQQVGDWKLAGKLHLRVLKQAPNTALGYLHAGRWLVENGNEEAAAAAFSVVLDLQPELIHDDQQQPTIERQLLGLELSDQHQSACEQIPASSAVTSAIWVRTHNKKFSFPETTYQPSLFYIPSIERRAFWPAAEFDWNTELEAKTVQIKQELADFLTRPSAQDAQRPYLPADMHNLGSLQELAGNQNWSALDLYRGGVLNEPVANHFAKTLDALADVPTYGLSDHPYEIFFSILKPNQSIAPHFGESNHALTVHLPLEVPAAGYLEVDGEQRSWCEGELIVFDDSYLHAAHNSSDEIRIVLIFSIWHPQLTLAERQAIQSSFKARNDWYSQRGPLLERGLTGN